MTIADIISQIDYSNGKVVSKTSGIEYKVEDFIEKISKAAKLTKRQTKELESYFIDYIRPQSDNSKYVEAIIDKYSFKFSDGVYFLLGNIVTMDEIYRILWKNERLLPSEVDLIVENVEKISEPMELQDEIYEVIFNHAVDDGKKSEYLKGLDDIYEGTIPWRSIIHNILVPKSTPLFHIFYDDGVGGTGKSTFLEILIKIVGERFVSNVLLDQFSNRFIFANMLGKYLNIGDDNGKNDELQNVGTLKSIITGNRVTIDRKNISPIEVRIFAKQLFATNILPYIDFTDGGIMRRLNIVKMNKIIPRRAKLPLLDEKELGRIINEAIEAPDLRIGNNELAITSSPLYRFFDKHPNGTYENYQSFCYQSGFRAMNVINFETKSKFIKAFNLRKGEVIDIKEQAEIPFD